jgi:glycine dehydrogenase subunit 1
MIKGEMVVHPYIPNSAPEIKAQMLREIGITDIDELYEDIPVTLRFKGEMKLPKALTSEMALKKHIEKILNKNRTCDENVSFLGGGCSQHYVPAICDEITGRSEFLTAYAGEPYEDHGRFQALFEYESLMAELLDMDVVNVPTYDWGQAASTSIRMAERITQRGEILIADTVSPDRLAIMRNYCHPVMTIRMVKHKAKTGQMDLTDLKNKLTPRTAAVYFENPSYLGFIEEQGLKIAETLHANGSIVVVGCDPVSLGVMKPPAQYGADIVCGGIQGLGNPMYFGGVQAGFIATRDEEKFVMEYPSRLFGVAKTSVEGEWGFGDVAYDRTSFGVREKGREFVGTAAALWGIGTAVYLSLMGPQGMQDLGITILQRSQYAQKKLSQIDGIRIRFQSAHFKEFVVDFSESGVPVKAINEALKVRHIFGGKDLSQDFPDLQDCALYCVTEVHTKSSIDDLVKSIQDICKKR